MATLRVLGVVRLSSERDESTSPERQRALIETWARANGHVIAGWAEDLDVSGNVSPFKRPGLGPWLATPHRFDVLACWKLDRLSRKVVHFSELMDWCDDKRKTIVSVTEGVDMSTPMGRMFAHIIAAFAQGELETIRERTTASHAKLRQDGRYAGSPPPCGYVAADRPGGGKTLVQEPVYAEILRGMIRDVIDGYPTSAIARRLNSEGVATWGDRRKELRGLTVDKPQRWTADTVQQIVKSPACAGYKVVKDRNTTPNESGPDKVIYQRGNRIVYDAEGDPVMATDEPVVTSEQWMKAKAALESRATRRGRASGTENMLQGVAFCGCCGTNLYHQSYEKKTKSGPRTYSYYRCPGNRRERECTAPAAIDVAAAEAQVTRRLLDILDRTEITREEIDHGEDYSAEIAQASARLDELEDDYMAGRYTGTEARERYHRLHAKAAKRVDDLKALPQRPASVRRVGTGETYGQRWRSMDDREAKRAFLIAQGFRAVVVGAGQVCHGPHCEQPCGAPQFHELADQVVGEDDLWCCYDDDNQPNKRTHVRLICPDTIWAVEQSDDGNEITMTLQVPTGARLG